MLNDLLTLGNRLHQFVFQKDDGNKTRLPQEKHPDNPSSGDTWKHSLQMDYPSSAAGVDLQLQKEWLHFTSPKRLLGDQGVLWQAVKVYETHKSQLEGETAWAVRSDCSDCCVWAHFIVRVSVKAGAQQLN